jgi:pimeloyl-ACP methyl ester carboxylesterase
VRTVLQFVRDNTGSVVSEVPEGQRVRQWPAIGGHQDRTSFMSRLYPQGEPLMRITRSIYKIGLGVVAGLLSLAVTLTLSPGAGNAGPSQSAKPTIVLVHGAWADGSSWDEVTRFLQNDGYPVVVVANPLRGLQPDTAYLKARLAHIPGPIVLAAHSYGGMVITGAATGNPNVKGLVYVDAFIPEKGEALGNLTGQSALNPDTSLDPVPLDSSGAVDLYIKTDVFPNLFAGGVDKHTAAVLAAGQRPILLSALSEPLNAEPAWKTIPSWDLIGTGDRVIPQAQQETMAGRAGSHVVKVKGPHLSMVSSPKAVRAIIVDAAQQH